ncbi:hypothetical protein VKT23_010803 [Stygiomarasmius scandens]|uniref:Uncharacterized protein n=1 Tax=Marasmiellus scandens TaxID=2682957 RepID=A0ABR1JB50_9AGAR
MGEMARILTLSQKPLEALLPSVPPSSFSSLTSVGFPHLPPTFLSSPLPLPANFRHKSSRHLVLFILGTPYHDFFASGITVRRGRYCVCNAEASPTLLYPRSLQDRRWLYLATWINVVTRIP